MSVDADVAACCLVIRH